MESLRPNDRLHWKNGFLIEHTRILFEAYYQSNFPRLTHVSLRALSLLLIIFFGNNLYRPKKKKFQMCSWSWAQTPLCRSTPPVYYLKRCPPNTNPTKSPNAPHRSPSPFEFEISAHSTLVLESLWRLFPHNANVPGTRKKSVDMTCCNPGVYQPPPSIPQPVKSQKSPLMMPKWGHTLY